MEVRMSMGCLVLTMCGAVLSGIPAQDMFLTLLPPVESELAESMLANNPFAEEESVPANGEGGAMPVETGHGWKQVLQETHWTGVLLPSSESPGLVIAADRLIRVGETLVCEEVQVRLVEVGDQVLVWENDAGERTQVKLQSFHKRRHPHEN